MNPFCRISTIPESWSISVLRCAMRTPRWNRWPSRRDRYGYAATERGQLQYGTWYLTEDPATTPEGYEGIRDVKIEIREDGDEQIYVVTNKPYQAYLCIRKVDQDTGAAIIRSQAEFQIWDSEGSPVQMPTFDGYTDTFRTNEKGEIHLTRSLKGGGQVYAGGDEGAGRIPDGGADSL